MKKFVCVLLSLITILSAVTVIPFSAASTDADAQESAPAKEAYSINGITYYNTHSASFDKDKEKYYVDLFDTESSALSDASYCDRSMSRLWLQLALGLIPQGYCAVGDPAIEYYSKTEDALLNASSESGTDYFGKGFTA